MKESSKTTLWILAYALVVGLLLTMFTLIDGFIKYLFSLLAFFAGIRFFREYERIGLRILFIVLSVIFFFMLTIIYVAYKFAKDNPDLLTSMA